MAWLKVAGWQLPRLRGKQVFLAPCLGGSGTGLINHGEEHQVLVFILVPTPMPALFSLPSLGYQLQSWKPLRATAAPHGPHLASLMQSCTLPQCCLLRLWLASSHTVVSSGPFLPTEHYLQVPASLSHPKVSPHKSIRSLSPRAS